MVSFCSDLATVARSGVLLIASCLPLHQACAADGDEILNRWFAAGSQLRTWSAEFTQTRHLQVLAQPLSATGKVWFAMPNQFRWELGQPPQTIALRQPDEVLIIYPRLKRVERYALSGEHRGPARDALALMEAGFPRSRADLESRFRLLSLVQTNALLHVTLQPKNAGIRRLTPEILLGIRTNDFSLEMMEMRFSDGSRMRNDFANAHLNRPLPPELFEVKLSPDFTVVEPLRP